MTLAALLQAASPQPTKIYGLWKPTWDWGVFGPYVSRNHFAGYMAMAIPLAVGFAVEALLDLRLDWARRGKRRWVALGDPAGNAAVRRSAVSVVLLVGLLASQSRGGLLGLGAALLAVPLAFHGRRRAAAALAFLVLIAVALYWVDVGPIRRGFETRGVRASRFDLWRDGLRMFPHFPVLGSGLDTFGTAYEPYQTLSKYHWVGEVHNEYLQALLDLGLVGAALVAGLVVILLRSAFRAGATSPLDAGILGALLACCAHNLVDFNWQIPANAATFAALAGLAVRGAARAEGGAVESTSPAA
jgi:O-antigen ligase